MNAQDQTTNRLETIRAAWLSFQQGRYPTGVREPIIRSWQRSRAAGVSPRLPGAPLVWDRSQLAAARAHNEDLIEAASPYLADLERGFSDQGMVLVLLDPEVRALLVRGDSKALAAGEKVLLVPGSDWSEVQVGTNAMGTAFMEGTHVRVLAAEHYLERLHSWSCVAAPIRHPRTGDVVGFLDFSAECTGMSPHADLVLQSTIAAIQSRLAAEDLRLRSCLLEAFSDRLSQQRLAPLAAVDRFGQLVKASQAELSESLARPELEAALRKMLAAGVEVQTSISVGGRPISLTLRPVHLEQRIVGALVEAAAPLSRPAPRPAAKAEDVRDTLVGSNPAWLATLERAMRVARTDSTVLITGETGTGKEVLARAIHRASPRSKGPWVPVNCGALPPSLALSQLFGYVGGAFTGANPKGSAGLVESADGGTLFLDEVGELAPEVQVALLRFLEERKVYRVGGNQPKPVDVRLIAATNRDLLEMVQRGEFRQDLYYRLNVVPLHIPPLRERREDILPLVEHAYRRLGVVPPDLGFASCQRLTSYNWPGNVRELMNLVEQAVALNEDPANLLPLPPLGDHGKVPLSEYGEEEQIRKALEECQGNAAAAARQLGISRTTLYRKLEYYGIRLKRQVN